MGRPNVTWTPLFKGSDVATNIDKAFTGTREQVWLNAFPSATSDSYGYQWELIPGLWGASLLT